MDHFYKLFFFFENHFIHFSEFNYFNGGNMAVFIQAKMKTKIWQVAVFLIGAKLVVVIMVQRQKQVPIVGLQRAVDHFDG